jgi:hypothetical protein
MFWHGNGAGMNPGFENQLQRCVWRSFGEYFKIACTIWICCVLLTILIPLMLARNVDLMEMVLPDANSYKATDPDNGQPQRIKGFSLVTGRRG